MMDADGGNPVNLTDDLEYNFEPTWSPDGQRIAFSRTLSFNGLTDWDIWVMRCRRQQFSAVDPRAESRPESGVVSRRSAHRL